MMIKANLTSITRDAWEITLNKKYVNAQIAEALVEVEANRKDALAIYEANDLYWIKETNARYDRIAIETVDSIISSYHNDQSYYFIYKDGSCISITADEILRGAKRPLLSEVVYARLSSADDDYDTETGNLDFYSDDRMAACDWVYEVEDERKWQYETAIEFKFGTEWSRKHPELNPAT